MRERLWRVAGRIKSTVWEDLRSDPYLRYILVVSLITGGFWIWYRTPNFVTPDEYGRLLRPMKAAGYFIGDPSLASFAKGATDGLAQGATFYLYAFALLPGSIIVVVTGQLPEFATFGTISSRWTLWHAVPAWYWTSTVLVARLLNVFAAVSAVYVLYRLGTEAHDRGTGRLAALLLALSLGLIASAHEANEDTVMVLLLLLVVYLAYKYVLSGSKTQFLIAAFVGGLSIAFKLSGGTSVLILAGAYLLRARHGPDRIISELYKPRLLGASLLVGSLTIYLGMPNLLFGGPSELIQNISVQLSNKGTPSFVDAPPGYFLIRALLNAVGLPLFVGLLAGSFVGLRNLVTLDDKSSQELQILLLIPLLVYLAVFGSWSIVKTHHVLPMIPVLTLLAAPPLRALHNRGLLGRSVLAVLIVSTGLYAGFGTLQYANEPRDQAAVWIQDEVSENESITVFENSVADIGIVHGQELQHYDFVEEVGVERAVRNETTYTEWLLSTHERGPKYIQATESSMAYLDPLRRSSERYPRRAAYMEQLVVEESMGYEIVAEFGTRPHYDSYGKRLLFAGIKPRIEKLEPYVVILKRKPSAETNREAG